jgi:hypothetical protein
MEEQQKHWAIATPEGYIGQNRHGASAIFDNEANADSALRTNGVGYSKGICYVLTESEYSEIDQAEGLREALDIKEEALAERELCIDCGSPNLLEPYTLCVFCKSGRDEQALNSSDV